MSNTGAIAAAPHIDPLALLIGAVIGIVWYALLSSILAWQAGQAITSAESWAEWHAKDTYKAPLMDEWAEMRTVDGVRVSEAEFSLSLQRALTRMPNDIATMLSQRSIFVGMAEVATDEQNAGAGLAPGMVLLGVFTHLAGHEEITLFARTIVNSIQRAELETKVADILYHEVGHALGLSHGDMERMAAA